MSVDEEAIRQQVQDRSIEVNVTQNWLTPSGRRRSSPSYEATIQNDYLRESRTIKAKSLVEVQSKCREQHEKWSEKEIKGRVRDAKEREIAMAKAAAEAAANEAHARLDAVRSILEAGLSTRAELTWEKLYEPTTRTEFAVPPPPTPTSEEPPPLRTSFWERLLPPLSTWRALHRRHAHAVYEDFRADALREWHIRQADWIRRAGEHHANESASLSLRRQNNRRIDKFRLDLARGDREAVCQYLELVFGACAFPDAFPVRRAAEYEPHERTLTIVLALPAAETLSKVKDVRYAKGGSAAAMLSDSEHALLYRSALMQTILRTTHEVFKALDSTLVTNARLEGMVHDIDPATGLDRDRCVIALSVDRDRFRSIKLERVDPESCLRSLGVFIE